MSDIFKPRKTPKHLIIQEEFNAPRKRRVNIAKLLLLTLLILTLTWMVLQLR